MKKETIAKMIDHALLGPTLTDDQLEKECRLALTYKVASVCIKPYYLKRCVEILEGSTVKSSTVIGFPHGGHTTSIKVAEAEEALKNGCEELDVVVNIGKVLSGDWNFVHRDIKALTEVAHNPHHIIKIIFENFYLEDDHKIRLCEICAEVNADYAKTSTGFAGGGATLADIKLMRKHLPSHIQLKASGGIRTLNELLEFQAVGVARIGTSHTAEILEACPS